jgi:hypothetical protein
LPHVPLPRCGSTSRVASPAAAPGELNSRILSLAYRVRRVPVTVLWFYVRSPRGRPASAFLDRSGRAHAPLERESWRCGGVARLVVACLSRQEVH